MIFGRGTPVQKEWEAFIKREKKALAIWLSERIILGEASVRPGSPRAFRKAGSRI